MPVKTHVTLVFLAFTLFAAPVQGAQYLTEAQKELLLENSRALGLSREKEQAQNASMQSEQTDFLSKISPVLSRTAPISLGVITKIPTSHTLSVINNPRTQKQSIQSIFNNTSFGAPTYSSHSVSNRPVQQSRQVATATQTKGSNFFKNLSGIASAIISGLNQANSQFQPYIQQPNYPHVQQPNKQIIHTYRVGNQTYGLGGNQSYRAYDVGNLTFGRMGDQEFRKYNFGESSLMKIGNSKLICRQVGNLEVCN